MRLPLLLLPVLLLLLPSALVTAAIDDVDSGGNMRLLYRLMDDCSRQEHVGVCLKLKALGALERAVASKSLQITSFVALTKDDGDDVVKSDDESDLEASLPRAADQKDDRLDQMLLENVQKLLENRSLQITFPWDAFEGRRRKDKMGGALLMGAAALAGMMMQLALGKIALIAGKALLVAKVALVLSAVIGLKKLLGGGGGGGGGGDSHPQVIYATESHGGGWSHRSLRDRQDVDAHRLAYGAHEHRQEEPTGV